MLNKREIIEKKVKKLFKQNPRRLKLSKKNGVSELSPSYDINLRLRENRAMGSEFFWGIELKYETDAEFKYTLKRLSLLEEKMKEIPYKS